jgi:uncharacterized membrane protein
MELTRTNRIASIDILRGIVMIIMALDHTRDYFHKPAFLYDPLDLTQTTPIIFLTRWITHFCAPTFVFLSGVSAFLASQKKTKNEASLFLIKRGFWLVLVEIVVVTFGITFKPYTLIVWQVIWAIGWSMIFLGMLMRISYKLVLITGVVLVFGHNLFDKVIHLPDTGAGGIVSTIFFRANPSFIPVGNNFFIADIYAILPWTGVMLLGFSMGQWFKKDFPAAKRKKLLLITGVSLIVLFILLRSTGLYGNPDLWERQNTLIKDILSFINTDKYPPSLLYLCMTIGPACLFLALTENIKSKWADIVSVYGQVPFFYYILHFYLLHILVVIFFYASGHGNAEIVDPNTFFNFRPVNFGYKLLIVYIIWIGVVGLLYFPCRWFSKYKKTHTQWWLSYV